MRQLTFTRRPEDEGSHSEGDVAYVNYAKRSEALEAVAALRGAVGLPPSLVRLPPPSQPTCAPEPEPHPRRVPSLRLRLRLSSGLSLRLCLGLCFGPCLGLCLGCA